MKLTRSLLAIAFAGMLMAGCKQTDNAPKTETGNDVAASQSNLPAKMETASFSIEGMTCAMGCAKTIEKKLADMSGVEKATVDFDQKTATVEFDANKQTPETLVKTVESAADGKTYKVSDVKASGDHAAVLHEKEKDKKKKKSKKDAKADDAKSETRGQSESSGAKPACCSGKKHCSSDENKA